MGETDCSLVGYGTLTEKDWNVLYDLASNQGLTETVFSAIEKLPKSQLPPYGSPHGLAGAGGIHKEQ